MKILFHFIFEFSNCETRNLESYKNYLSNALSATKNSAGFEKNIENYIEQDTKIENKNAIF